MAMRASIIPAALALLGACTTATTPMPPAGSVDALAQVGRWTLQGATDARGTRVDAAFPGGVAVHVLVFEDGSVALEGGCNRIWGTYRIDRQGRLVIDPLRATKMACADERLMDADQAVSSLVEGRSTWRIAESWPEQLTLDHADGHRSNWIADR